MLRRKGGKKNVSKNPKLMFNSKGQLYTTEGQTVSQGQIQQQGFPVPHTSG